MKHKTKPCALCEAIKAIERKFGKRAQMGPKNCEACGGTGLVPDIKHHRYEKRRKDMTGEEWTEADSRWEREREYMEREE
jgi:hypothetical protein